MVFLLALLLQTLRRHHLHPRRRHILKIQDGGLSLAGLVVERLIYQRNLLRKWPLLWCESLNRAIYGQDNVFFVLHLITSSVHALHPLFLLATTLLRLPLLRGILPVLT